ncbi:MAG: MBL fold metallo-hydrolase [Ignavibacteriaceae bacterium]|nr:MBL fold metallo-hydrolase [Ignavibacteriaceae bacterium]
MFLRFWGTRGSIPVPGKSTLKYGGNTPCVELRTSDNQLIILDAGSGLRELGKSLVQNGGDKSIHIFISHYHWDHIQGIPFFMPLYEKGKDITFYGEGCSNKKVKEILGYQMTANYFPINLDEAGSKTKFIEIKTDSVYQIGNVKVETRRANHSSPTISYKFTEGNKKIVYMTDNELHAHDSQDDISGVKILDKYKELVEFCSDCDYLIHDSMYDEISVLNKKGWGHTGNITLAYFSILAKVKNLVLFHYNPDYCDEKIDDLLKETLSVLNSENSTINCVASKEGMCIEL